MADSKPPKPDGPSPNKINTLMALAGRKPAAAKQGHLDLVVEKHLEIAYFGFVASRWAKENFTFLAGGSWGAGIARFLCPN